MSHAHRPSLLQQSSASSNFSHTSTTLTNRIAQKRLELENLRQLRDLSAQLASQIGVLEEKLSMLNDGTEGVAEVLRNWRGVLSVLGLVGGEMREVMERRAQEGQDVEKDGQRLPGTLVRIPVDDGVNESSGDANDSQVIKGKEKRTETGG